MPRALASFHKLGIDAVPAPTDFGAEPRFADWLLRWLLDTESLGRSSRAKKENLGIWLYRLRDWA